MSGVENEMGPATPPCAGCLHYKPPGPTAQERYNADPRKPVPNTVWGFIRAMIWPGTYKHNLTSFDQLADGIGICQRYEAWNYTGPDKTCDQFVDRDASRSLTEPAVSV